MKEKEINQEELAVLFRQELIEQLEEVISIKFNNIGECIGVLQHVLKKEYKEVVNELKSARHIDHGGIQYYQILADTLPNMLRSTLFITIYSHLEQSLTAICDQLQASFNFRVAVKDLQGRGCERCRTYLIKVVGIEFPEKYWEPIKFYMELRNYLVHSGIHLNNITDRGNKLIEKVKTIDGLELDRYNTLLFSQEFLTDALETISNFLSAIFRTIEKFSNIRAIK